MTNTHARTHTDNTHLPIQKNNLGQGKVQFTGMHNSNRLLLRDGSLG